MDLESFDGDGLAIQEVMDVVVCWASPTDMLAADWRLPLRSTNAGSMQAHRQALWSTMTVRILSSTGMPITHSFCLFRGRRASAMDAQLRC